MYWIEYDINNLEDDDFYLPKGHSMEYADNQINPLNEINDYEDADYR